MADQIEKALKRLQHAAREQSTPPAEPGHSHMFFGAPSPNPGEASVTVELHDEGVWALHDLCDVLEGDLRFEYMQDGDRKSAAQEFAATAAVRSSENHVSSFINRHEHEVLDLTCAFTIEHLILDQRRELFGATLIPTGEAQIPGLFSDESSIDSVLEVPSRGTDGTRMMERAKETAEHALRLLRAGLRGHRSINDDQLRFRLGIHYWFTVAGQARPGWKRRPGEPLTFGPLNDKLVEIATSPAIATLPEHGGNDVERRANRALAWWERSFLASDPTVKVVFLFAALEAILGDKGEGLKGHTLALRRAALSESLEEGFSNPYRNLALYELVRSKAIHGEQPEKVPRNDLVGFEWDVREAISEYLRYANENNLTQRKEMRASLAAKVSEIEAFLDGS